jgi:hypothetical protein
MSHTNNSSNSNSSVLSRLDVFVTQPPGCHLPHSFSTLFTLTLFCNLQCKISQENNEALVGGKQDVEFAQRRNVCDTKGKDILLNENDTSLP